MNKDLETVIDWIPTTTLSTHWDVIAGAGWAWKKSDWNNDFKDTVKHRYDFEFEAGTRIEEIVAATRLRLAIEVPFTFEGVDDAEIVSAFMYAEHAHNRTHPLASDHPMDEVTVFLRFKK